MSSKRYSAILTKKAKTWEIASSSKPLLAPAQVQSAALSSLKSASGSASVQAESNGLPKQSAAAPVAVPEAIKVESKSESRTSSPAPMDVDQSTTESKSVNAASQESKSRASTPVEEKSPSRPTGIAALPARPSLS